MEKIYKIVGGSYFYILFPNLSSEPYPCMMKVCNKSLNKIFLEVKTMTNAMRKVLEIITKEELDAFAERMHLTVMEVVWLILKSMN